MKKLPLVNIENKKIPIGPKIQHAIRKEARAKGKVPQTFEMDAEEESNSPHPFEKPVPYTTAKLAKALEEIKNEKPNIEKMLENKLASPNTAKYLRKKKASKLNIPASKTLYKDLVSLDVCEEALLRNLEEDFRRRAAAVRPPPRLPDPEPTLTDYFKEEDFLSVRTVGPSNIFPRSTPLKPYQAEPESLFSYTDILLGRDELA